jgi:pimeloyl-ACP methyl ester carboxylesterase
MTPHARQNHLRASNNHDSWDALPTIKAPTLILHGSDDKLDPVANAWLLARRIPHSQVRILARGRHAYFHEFREIASALANEFLASAER